MDYYEILGLPESASEEDIKKAYKRLAMKHHPDRGGDTGKFQEISAAYDTLVDPEKRQMYNAQRNGFQFHSSANFNDMSDVFEFAFGGGFGPMFGHGFRQNRQAKNKDLSIRIQISLKQAFVGTEIESKFTTPSGKQQTVAINIPPGINSGQTIRYTGLGDDTLPNVPRGNLNVQIFVEPSEEYIRNNDNIYTKLTISLIEAMGGCTKQVENIDGKQYNVKINPGTRQSAEYSLKGKGFINHHTKKPGDFVIVVDYAIPEITDPSQLEQLSTILTS